MSVIFFLFHFVVSHDVPLQTWRLNKKLVMRAEAKNNGFRYSNLDLWTTNLLSAASAPFLKTFFVFLMAVIIEGLHVFGFFAGLREQPSLLFRNIV